MANELQRIDHGRSELGQLAESVRDYLRQSKSASTWRAYQSDLKHFRKFCKKNRVEALPATPDTVANYLGKLAENCKVSTINRRVVAISQVHKAAGHPSPTANELVRGTLKGIRRDKGIATETKSPTLIDDIRAMVARLPAGIIGVRDRALLLVGFAGAFRRSEIVFLNRNDCAFTREGLVITLRRSKTDQEGEGAKIAIAYGSTPETCPVRALQDWIERAAIGETAALFRPVNKHSHISEKRLSGKAVALIVKRYAKRTGLDHTKYSGHSLRAGCATEAAIRGNSERSIMNQTRHRSVKQLRSYIRDGNLFRDNVSAKLGL